MNAQVPRVGRPAWSPGPFSHYDSSYHHHYHASSLVSGKCGASKLQEASASSGVENSTTACITSSTRLVPSCCSGATNFVGLRGLPAGTDAANKFRSRFGELGGGNFCQSSLSIAAGSRNAKVRRGIRATAGAGAQGSSDGSRGDSEEEAGSSSVWDLPARHKRMKKAAAKVGNPFQDMMTNASEKLQDYLDNMKSSRSKTESDSEKPESEWERIQRRDFTLKPAEVYRVNGSLLRAGLIIACPSLGLGMIDSNALAAAELGPISSSSLSAVDMLPRFVSHLGDLDPGTAQLATSFVGPVITVFNLLFIFRIVMSWYPGIPVKKFPFFLAYNPTEPVLGPTRRLIPPVGGVDVAPVIWVALMSFANEILLGKQGLLVLLSQQQS